MSQLERSRTLDAKDGKTEWAQAQESRPGALPRALRSAATLGLAAATYMVFEAQWIECREADLKVDALPTQWKGLRVLHLSDVHAGLFFTNELSLRKAVRWASLRSPDLVLLTGDILGDVRRSSPCLELLSQLRPHLGTYAVTGNHEYGIGKDPLARPRDTTRLWEEAGITLLRDRCVSLPPRKGSSVILCGADYVTGGHTLTRGNPRRIGSNQDFPVLLTHEPPGPESPLARLFSLAFAGHTHGGQLRFPARTGLEPIHKEGGQYLQGVEVWGAGRIVVSRGVGTSFLPFRLLARPEATLWRLV
jgi:predicted MPP superfamily phosphohydrolase